MLIANAEDVTAGQRLAELFVASNMATLIEQPVERALACGMRMYQDELVAITHNLGMEAGDDGFVDDDIVGRVASDVDFLFVQWVAMFPRIGVATNLK